MNNFTNRLIKISLAVASSFAFTTLASAQYVSTASLQKNTADQRLVDEIAFLNELIGKTLWIVPTSQSKYYAFYKKITKPEINYQDEFLPTQPTSFDVIELIKGVNYLGSREYAYRVRFADGMEGYLKAFSLGDTYIWRQHRLSNSLRDLESTSNDRFFTESPDAIRAAAAMVAAEKLEKEREQEEQRLAKEKELKKALIAAEKESKRKGGVRIGMSAKQVRASNWGAPNSINSTVTAHGVDEQWVYGTRSYLYFHNGVLTAIQN